MNQTNEFFIRIVILYLFCFWIIYNNIVHLTPFCIVLSLTHFKLSRILSFIHTKIVQIKLWIYGKQISGWILCTCCEEMICQKFTCVGIDEKRQTSKTIWILSIESILILFFILSFSRELSNVVSLATNLTHKTLYSHWYSVIFHFVLSHKYWRNWLKNHLKWCVNEIFSLIWIFFNIFF